MFAIAFIVSVSLFVAVLEYKFEDTSGGYDYGLLDEVAQELELSQPLPQNDMAPVEVRQNETTELTDNLNIIDGEDVDLENLEFDINNIGTYADLSDLVDDGIEEPLMADKTDEPISFRVVECLPEFPGGMSEFIKWLTKNLKYPAAAQKKKIQGKVVVSFIVNKDGSISDEKIMRNADKQLDNEALRVIKMMPKWKPGQMYGVPCRTMLVIPVVFAL